jgi:hypothetical protein
MNFLHSRHAIHNLLHLTLVRTEFSLRSIRPLATNRCVAKRFLTIPLDGFYKAKLVASFRSSNVAKQLIIQG